jgi:hypothetical protein
LFHTCIRGEAVPVDGGVAGGGKALHEWAVRQRANPEKLLSDDFLPILITLLDRPINRFLSTTVN